MSLSTLPKLKVLISGAGIAGPCLAYWLARTRLNTSITVLERSPVPRPTGQAIEIRGPAIEVIKRMKLEEAVRSRTTTEEGTRFLSSSGKTIAEFGLGDAFTAEYEILRADLCGLFLEATESLKNVEYIYGDHVTSLQQTERSVVVSFAGGAKQDFDLVVGADGATSKIRSLILDEEARKDSYKLIGQYVAYFSIPRQPSDTKHWYWYNAPKGLGLMTRPHRNPSTIGAYALCTLPAHGQRDPAFEEAMDQGTDAQKRIWHKYLDNLGWEAKRILNGMDQADDFYMSRAAQVKLPKWTNGRAVLLGDAAFATFGIGTTLAIHSAYVLAGELSKIQSTSDIPKALGRYEEVFRSIHAKFQDLPPGFPQFAFPQTAWGLGLRDSALWLASKTKAYKLLPTESEENSKLTEYDWVSV
ncbi:FAD/NAD(P)-binding domain-containing protein [Cucurbitaria berberidis CBS 394.84]|uniref:FAD/NAD(P)-binding domain-containing protein n=1 Tax=Cucurbitaria berberidis CBS 394.84 TaxID=1168544 RepID=A0A9P4LFA7_9PLEO|nr:FAD/NAD(P)-binding domain-containing protein [Cucurbitaria berberidis CBS 394.84]KAF1852217.1 FAD/NAD(P)-binding domain-containing protein [Cucurbitaria berberidis CBS 394.84]